MVITLRVTDIAPRGTLWMEMKSGQAEKGREAGVESVTAMDTAQFDAIMTHDDLRSLTSEKKRMSWMSCLIAM